MEEQPSENRRSFIAGVVIGLKAYFKVVPVMFRNGLWPVQLLPALISLILSVGMAFSFYLISGKLTEWLDGLITLPWEWLDTTLDVTIRILTFLILAAAFVFAHKHIVIVVLSPLLGKVAEVTHRAVTSDSETSPLAFTAAMARSIQINFGNVFKELSLNLVFLLCNFIPVVGSLVSSAGLFFTQARFLGYGLMDFPLEHRQFSVSESMAWMKKREGISTGLGAGYVLLMLIPFVGWMFAPTFGAVAGTLLAIDELDSENSSC
ncbi:EI24 domain-containing protein [Verrucomicrobiales bacterium]|nr:EI24 domain-containing protein [Verrucomicrobiales bacterium]